MKKWGSVLILCVQTVLLVFVTLFCVIPVSCKVSEEGILFVGGDYVSPTLDEVSVLDENTVQMSFSEKIRLKNYVISQQVEEVCDSYEHSQTVELSPAIMNATGGYGKVEADYSVSEDGCVITYEAADGFEIGRAYEIFGTVADKAGNSLTFCVPFIGYNSHLPKLVMTEVQPKYKKQKEDAFRCEFVEILALTDGNMSGLELIGAVDGAAKKYIFPALTVKAGEVFVVHLRSAGSGCVSEVDDLNESTALYSGKDVRDLWSENEKARLNDTADVIVIKNSVDGKLLDAFMYAAEETSEWGKAQSALAEEVLASGIYDDISPCEVELNSGLGSVAAKSFCRGDAKELQALALEGVFAEDSESPAEYPVKRRPENWSVKNVSPGTL